MQESNGLKHRFLVLGGNGFIGRNFIEYLITNNIASKIKIVDKVPPQLSWLNHKHKDLFSNELIEYKSANLINASSTQKAFEDQIGFDFVVNLAAETRFGQSDPVYKEGVFKLSLNCAKEAAKRGIKKYIEISSGQYVSNQKESLIESVEEIESWTALAKYKLDVERELPNITNLNYVILRPALVYGIGDRYSVTPRLVIGAVYKHLGEVMKLLWNKELKMNTVHVQDVCSAIWFTCLDNRTNGQIYNVVDKSDTSQGSLSDIISDIFGICNDYWGNAMSSIAIKTNGFDALVEEINDKHMGPWFDLCAKYSINNTPINPFLYTEMLQNKHLFLNGNKLQKLGFSYKMPRITREAVIEIIEDYIEMGLFPKICQT